MSPMYAASHASHILYTPILGSTAKDGSWWDEWSWSNLSHSVWPQPAQASSSIEHVTEVTELWDYNKPTLPHQLSSISLALPKHWMPLNSGSGQTITTSWQSASNLVLKHVHVYYCLQICRLLIYLRIHFESLYSKQYGLRWVCNYSLIRK